MELAIIQNTAELERLEGIITRNLQCFYEVGRALAEIRDREYYRDVLGFETFEAYCKAKWDFASNYARKLIASADVVDNIQNGTMVPPVNERQTRPLSRLDPGQQREAWKEAVDTARGTPGGKVTAAIVSIVVKAREANKPKKKSKQEKHSRGASEKSKASKIRKIKSFLKKNKGKRKAKKKKG